MNYKNKILKGIIVALLSIAGFWQPLYAETLVDAAAPFTAGPINPQNGFTLWVQDSTGLTLEMCLDSIDGLGTPPNCFYDPPQTGNLFSEQIGFGAEAFWWAADALIDLPATGFSATLVQAVEAAFLTETAVDGEQFPFTRMRIRVDVPEPGVYTVTHPYGQEVYVVQTVNLGDEIRETFDIEITPESLNQGRVGPLLTWDTFGLSPLNGGPPEGFIGDGVTEHRITGSPLGTNFFRVEGVDFDGLPILLDGDNVAETDLFIVIGKVFTGVAPAPLTVTRASYTRDGSGQVEVFANSAPGAFVQVSDGGAGLINEALKSDGSGRFFGMISLADPSTLPSVLEITATNAGNDPTTIRSQLTDNVIISRAEYDVSSGLLTIAADSSDALVTGLTAAGFGSVPVSFDTPAPPAAVTVTSSAGGTASAPIRIIAGTNIPPTAADDTAETGENTSVVIDILANDTDADNGIAAETLALIQMPANGSAVVDTAFGSTVTYTPNLNFNGLDGFSYLVRDASGAYSNVATVSINVIGFNTAPLAADDSVSVNIGESININVLANDTDADFNLDPTSVIIASDPTLGTATVLSNGVITYQAGPDVGTDNFTYTVKDSAGLESNPATVMVALNDRVSEVITISRAQYRTNSSEWRITGTSTIPGPGNSIDIYLGGDLNGPLFATAPVDALGLWEFREKESSTIPGDVTQITVHSSSGVILTVSLQIR